MSEKAFQDELNLLREGGVKSSPLRLEYEAQVRKLTELREELEARGMTERDIARTLHERRRELGRIYKDAAPPLFREYIYYATAQKYGDPLGPTFEELCRSKSYAQIIESASRPIRDLGERLTLDGFIAWFNEKRSDV